jgi:ADP-dependent NAD(P)H-hydrate dehydratase / NAD(P)H-hydrate epimerase
MKTTPVFLTPHIRAIEHWARSQDDPPPLLERAGLRVADLTQQIVTQRARRILILAGPGNNGGDALVAARHLKAGWFDVRVVFTGEAEKLKADARAAFTAWQGTGGETLAAIPRDWRWDLAIDGLFGIGLARDIDARHAELVTALNASGKAVLAIDVPSGLDADTGRIHGVAVRATHTLTFLGLKAGLLTLDGPDYAGRIHLDRLGLENAPLPENHGYILGADTISSALPQRARNSHKGLFGDVGILGGAEGMVGAALLAGRAALKLGAGRVFVGLLAGQPAVDLLQPDLMLRRAEEVLSRAQLSCVVVGPGLGQASVAQQLLQKALHLEVPVVLDADALNLLSGDENARKALSVRIAPSLLTPHPAEAARLLGTDVREVQNDRIKAACALAEQFNGYVVLKGSGSICAAPGARWWINATGNPGMSSAGMGDVLAGILGALLAQGASPERALLASVHVHGLAADELVARGVGPVGLTASETIDAARSAWNRLSREGPNGQNAEDRHQD